MKKSLFFTLLLIVISICTYAQQGIAVQGIARDNEKSAITNETLEFTFSIKDGTALVFSETTSIKTDDFGVFSHIVGTGTVKNGKIFNQVDFSKENLKIKVELKFGNSNIVVYEKAFQYTPYAKYAEKAENGVPVGTIVANAGKNAPEGWVMCDGSNLDKDEHKALKTIVGDKTPDLRGRFLRGADASPDLSGKIDSVALRQYQGDMSKEFVVQKDSFNAELSLVKGAILGESSDNKVGANWNYGLTVQEPDPLERNPTVRGALSDSGHTSFKPSEKITLTNYIKLNQVKAAIPELKVDIFKGNIETRPHNYGVNYIIKY